MRPGMSPIHHSVGQSFPNLVTDRVQPKGLEASLIYSR